MLKRLRFAPLGAVLLGVFALTPVTHAADTQPASAPADASTPKGALRLADQSVPADGVSGALGFYYATTHRDRELARRSAEVDVACSYFEQAVAQKFGRPAADEAIHALGAKVGSDIDAAQEKIQGDQAVVAFKDDDEPLHMVNVRGAWKVNVAAQIGSRGEAQVARQIDYLKHMAVGAERIADQVASGKLATAQQVIEACAQERQKLARMEH